MPLVNFLDARDTQKMRNYIEKSGIALKLGNILRYQGFYSPEYTFNNEKSEEVTIGAGNFLVLITTQTVAENEIEK